MKGGPGKSRRSRQRPEEPERGGLGKGDPQEVEGTVLTVVASEGGELLSPSPGDRWKKRGSQNERSGDRFGR